MNILPRVLGSFTVGLFWAALSACAAPTDDAPVSDTVEELRATYGSLDETLADPDVERWLAIRGKLVAGFDRVCGDTICSGDYANLTTVALKCSSTHAARKMKDCLWVLGGNVDYVDGRTGALSGDVRTFACHVPVAGSAKAFLAALEAAGDDALRAPIPGTHATFYDALVTCFAGVVAGTPPPVDTHVYYTEMSEALWARGAGAAWDETRRALAKGFDDVCGDTFCEGDYSDIVALRLACAMNERNGRVARCDWAFAGAAVDVDGRGMLSAQTMTKRCPIAVGASATDLAAALAGDAPLEAKLPGRATSIYDAIAACL